MVMVSVSMVAEVCIAQTRTSPVLSRATALAILNNNSQRPRNPEAIYLDPFISIEVPDSLRNTFAATEEGIKNGLPLKLPAVEEIPANFTGIRSSLLKAYFFGALEKASLLVKYKGAEVGVYGYTKSISIHYMKAPTPDVEWKFENVAFSRPEVHITAFHYDSGSITGIRQQGNSAEVEVEYQLIPTNTQKQIEDLAHALLRQHKQDASVCSLYNRNPGTVTEQTVWITILCPYMDQSRKPLKKIWHFERWDSGWRLASHQY